MPSYAASSGIESARTGGSSERMARPYQRLALGRMVEGGAALALLELSILQVERYI
jgi:hypothetical protein